MRNATPIAPADIARLKLPSIEELVGPPTKRRNASAKQREACLLEASERAQGKGWEGATSSVLLGLYCHLHLIVYGVAPAELKSAREWTQATMRVGSFLKNEFGGDAPSLAEFIAWTWRREEQRHKGRVARGEESRRLVWRWQFGPSLLTDYAAAGQQRRKVG